MGQFDAHRLHGRGRLATRAGAGAGADAGGTSGEGKYVGQFADNLFEGEGIQKTAEPLGLGGGSLHYAGQFRQGVRQGSGNNLLFLFDIHLNVFAVRCARVAV